MTSVEEFIFGVWAFILGLSIEKIGASFVVLLFASTILMHLEDTGSSRTYLIGLIGIPIMALILLEVIWVVL